MPFNFAATIPNILQNLSKTALFTLNILKIRQNVSPLSNIIFEMNLISRPRKISATTKFIKMWNLVSYPKIPVTVPIRTPVLTPVPTTVPFNISDYVRNLGQFPVTTTGQIAVPITIKKQVPMGYSKTSNLLILGLMPRPQRHTLYDWTRMALNGCEAVTGSSRNRKHFRS